MRFLYLAQIDRLPLPWGIGPYVAALYSSVDGSRVLVGVRWDSTSPRHNEYRAAVRNKLKWSGAFWEGDQAGSLLSRICRENDSWPVFGLLDSKESTPAELTIESGRYLAIGFPAGAPFGERLRGIVDATKPYCSSEPVVYVARDGRRLVLRVACESRNPEGLMAALAAGRLASFGCEPHGHARVPTAEVRYKALTATVRLRGDSPAHVLFARTHFAADRNWCSLDWRILAFQAGLWEDRLRAAGIDVVRRGTPKEVVQPLELRSPPPGWDWATAGGLRLYSYQRAGVGFLLQRGLRAILGDEMGVGKTAQVIAALEAAEVRRVIVVVPASARYVWDSEIRTWGRAGSAERIRHIDRGTNLASQQPTDARWLIVTYGLLLRPAVRRALAVQQDDVLVVDEAHYAKNEDAKRTAAVRKLAQKIGKCILITGTPLRNRVDEGFALLRHLLGTSLREVEETAENLRDLLAIQMLRRTKAEVLPSLPAKVRQSVEIDVVDTKESKGYVDALDSALTRYRMALENGMSHRDALMLARGEIEHARVLLGLAKVATGTPSELVAEIAEQKGAVVVFAEHHSVSDALAGDLHKRGIRVCVADGRMGPKERDRAKRLFQDGNIDVLIAGTMAMGESVTLTRSDTVVFLELNWVPAAMRQAEDRIHRVGQTAQSCHIIHLLARGGTEFVNIDAMLARSLFRKQQIIENVLQDGTSVALSEDGETAMQLIEEILRKVARAAELP